MSKTPRKRAAAAATAKKAIPPAGRKASFAQARRSTVEQYKGALIKLAK